MPDTIGTAERIKSPGWYIKTIESILNGHSIVILVHNISSILQSMALYQEGE